MKYVVSLLLLLFSTSAFAQFVAAPTYKFPTRIAVERYNEFSQLRVPMPVLEVRANENLQVYSHAVLSNVFIRGPQVITPIDRANYYHNGVSMKAKDGRSYYQMAQMFPNRRESVVGWLSSDQLINPPRNPVLTTSNTFFSTTSRCLSCGVRSAFEDLERAVDSFVYPNTRSVPDEAVAVPRDPNETPGCPIPAPYTATQTGRRGMRVHPILRITRMHHGSDWAPANPRTPLVAMMPGRVVTAGIAGGHGYRVVIQHEDGTLSSYSHLQIPLSSRPGCALPAEGAQIAKGAPLGCMGTTGLSTGVHLHLELYASREDFDNKRSMVQENWVDFRAACGGRFTSR